MGRQYGRGGAGGANARAGANLERGRAPAHPTLAPGPPRRAHPGESAMRLPRPARPARARSSCSCRSPTVARASRGHRPHRTSRDQQAVTVGVGGGARPAGQHGVPARRPPARGGAEEREDPPVRERHALRDRSGRRPCPACARAATSRACSASRWTRAGPGGPTSMSTATTPRAPGSASRATPPRATSRSRRTGTLTRGSRDALRPAEPAARQRLQPQRRHRALRPRRHALREPGRRREPLRGAGLLRAGGQDPAARRLAAAGGGGRPAAARAADPARQSVGRGPRLERASGLGAGPAQSVPLQRGPGGRRALRGRRGRERPGRRSTASRPAAGTSAGRCARARRARAPPARTRW